MQFRDLKYLAAYIVPLTCLCGLYFGGWASPGVLYFGFGFVPVIEYFLPAAPRNEEEEILNQKSRIPLFDILLYINIPLVYFICIYFIWLLANRSWTTAELIFSIINVGIVLGVSGINVAHELGHRKNSFDRWMARLLLLPVLYSHFTLEHNYGHHLNVATSEDPATARKGQPIYSFFIRSIFEGYRNAWKIEKKIIASTQRSKWKNELILTHVIQIFLLITVFYFSGWLGLFSFAGAALIGILVLECVNYIEHYGLIRKSLPSGRFEIMSEAHSWNSNHELGRIVLFELVRHSDHHYQTERKYQTLRHLEQSPQLPFGYPASIMIALIPPLWFRLMDRRLERFQALVK
ncbi:MAG: alkane 1-monooxygenase [Saprospiraceae bacterium]